MDAKELAGVPLFDGIGRSDIDRAAQLFDVVDVNTGYNLLDEGRFPHEFFIVLEGNVRVEHEGQKLAELGPGDFFGEIALIREERRTASVVADSPTRLAVAAVREFDTLLQSIPVVAARIDAAADERLSR
jgi:CRP/FNR family cyclic AMP-dependent transcriptional regulator